MPHPHPLPWLFATALALVGQSPPVPEPSPSKPGTPEVHASVRVGDIDLGSFCYTEVVNPTADLSDLKASFTGSNWLQTILEMYARRWPSGRALAAAQQKDQYFSQFVDKTTFNKFCESMMVAIHEETHMWDLDGSRTVWNDRTASWVDDTWQALNIPLHDGFPRKEILPLIQDDASASIDGTYLKDSQQGEYHFQGVTAELNASLMGLPAAAVVAEFIDGVGASNARDLALTNLSYLQMYLRVAKTNHPDFWNQIKAEPTLRKWVLIQFLRCAYWIDFSNAYAAKLGSARVPDLIARVYAAENVGIIEEFTGYKVPRTSNKNCMIGDALQAPVITTQPQPQTVTAGQPATFTVTATGAGPLTYRWKKNGAGVASGGTSATYTLAATETTDAGDYTVDVSNAGGTTTSASAKLTVQPVETGISINPTAITLQPGASTTFQATVTGTTNPTVTWTCTGGTITNGQYVAPSTPGDYEVVVTSVADPRKAAKAQVRVAATSPLVIATQPTGSTVCAGTTATLSVVASGGTAPLRYQWYRNGTALAGANAASLSFTAQASDNGAVFEVVVQDAAPTPASVRSQAVRLVVTDCGPKINSQPKNLTVTAGATATFSVGVSGGIAPVTFQWFKNGSAVNGATSATHAFTAQPSDDQSRYHVVITDSARPPVSITSAAATLTVTGAPQGKDILSNGDFESGASGWYGNTESIGTWAKEPAYSGVKAAWLGGKGAAGYKYLTQIVTIPSSAATATLNFALHIDTAEAKTAAANDLLYVWLLNSSGRTLATLATYSNKNAAAGYQLKGFDLTPYKGQTVYVYFYATENTGAQTSFVLDKVSLLVK